VVCEIFISGSLAPLIVGFDDGDSDGDKDGDDDGWDDGWDVGATQTKYKFPLHKQQQLIHYPMNLMPPRTNLKIWALSSS